MESLACERMESAERLYGINAKALNTIRRDEFYNEIARSAMKSEQSSDEILSLRLKMKLNPPRTAPREAGFHREVISSTEGGFLPPLADLAEKKHIC